MIRTALHKGVRIYGQLGERQNVWGLDTGVGDNCVQRPKRSNSAVDERTHLLGMLDIGLTEPCFAAELPYLGSNLKPTIGTAAGNGNIGAELGKGKCCGITMPEVAPVMAMVLFMISLPSSLASLVARCGRIDGFNFGRRRRSQIPKTICGASCLCRSGRDQSRDCGDRYSDATFGKWLGQRLNDVAHRRLSHANARPVFMGCDGEATSRNKDHATPTLELADGGADRMEPASDVDREVASHFLVGHTEQVLVAHNGGVEVYSGQSSNEAIGLGDGRAKDDGIGGVGSHGMGFDALGGEGGDKRPEPAGIAASKDDAPTFSAELLSDGLADAGTGANDHNGFGHGIVFQFDWPLVIRVASR